MGAVELLLMILKVFDVLLINGVAKIYFFLNFDNYSNIGGIQTLERYKRLLLAAAIVNFPSRSGALVQGRCVCIFLVRCERHMLLLLNS